MPQVAPEKNEHETRYKHHTVRYGLTGPVLLVAMGVIFLVGQFVPAWGVSKTWPVLLIVIGITKLLESIIGRGSTSPDK